MLLRMRETDRHWEGRREGGRESIAFLFVGTIFFHYPTTH